MGNLIKQFLAYRKELRWLKAIDRAVNKYSKAKVKARRKYIVLNGLVTRYNELFGKNLGVKGGKRRCKEDPLVD